MKPARIAVIAIAAVSAIGLALVVRAMGQGPSTSEAATAQVQAAPTVRVLVASRDLPVGKRIESADMEWKDWPVANLNPAYVTDGAPPRAAPAEAERAEAVAAQANHVAADLTGNTPRAAFIDAVVREQILSGEPILGHKLVRAGQSGYMAAFLEPGMRAMAIRVTVETAAGGFILPGDRVDVLLTRESRLSDVAGDQSGRSRFTSSTVMRNVKVLAIDQATTAGEEQAVIGATATLELSARDAEALALAKSEGELSLVLRSYADTAGPSGAVVSPRTENAAIRVFRNGQAETVVTQ